MSGFEVYRKAYRNVIKPEMVAELLILRADMPRSLAACMDEVVSNLQRVANEQSNDTLRRAGRLQADLRFGRVVGEQLGEFASGRSSFGFFPNLVEGQGPQVLVLFFEQPSDQLDQFVLGPTNSMTPE